MEAPTPHLAFIEVKAGASTILLAPEDLAPYEYIGKAVKQWQETFDLERLLPITVKRVVFERLPPPTVS